MHGGLSPEITTFEQVAASGACFPTCESWVCCAVKDLEMVMVMT